MNRFTIYISVIFMLFTHTINAQKQTKILLKWKVVAALPAENSLKKSLGFAGPVTGVHNDILFIGGGANFPDAMPWQGGKKKYYDVVYVYEKKANSVALKAKLKLESNIAYAACCSTPQGVVYAGGENENGISDKAFLLQWDNATATIGIINLPDLPIAITNAALTLNDDILYLAGGESANAVSDKFYALNLKELNSGWIRLPSLPRPVSHTVLLKQLKNGQPCIYLIGGRKKNTDGISQLYSSVYEFDITKNEWTAKKSLPYAISAGTGIATGQDEILIFGGDCGETFHKVETVIAAINAEKEELKKQELIQQKNKLLSSHPGFSKDVLLYNTEDDKWTMTGTIPFGMPVTTTAVLWENKIIIPSGEIKAGVRSPKILSVKILRKAK